MPRAPRIPCVHCHRGMGRSRRCRHCGAIGRVGEYVVEQVLAERARGRVYRARRAQTVVILKELAFATVPDAQAIELFERECVALAHLSHPRIPRFIERLADGSGVSQRHYLVQQYLPGESLEERLTHHTFDQREAVAIAFDVLEILEYLHERSPRLVHRDVKPANIIAQPDGRYALVDFGSIRRVGDERDLSCTLTGSFGYMPPERLSREADADADLYALGMSLARILSGRPPERLLTHSLEVQFRPYVNVSPAFSDFIEKLVARDPAARFPDAATAREALLSLLPPRPTSQVPCLRKWAPVPQPAPELRVKSEGEARPRAAPTARSTAWRIRIGTELRTLRPGLSYVLGREDDCDVRIDESLHRADTVSRRHLRLTVLEAGLLVEELGSTNATFVGETLLRRRGESVLLKTSAQLQVGRVVCDLVSSDASRVPGLLGYLGGDPEGVRVVGPNELRAAIRRSSR